MPRSGGMSRHSSLGPRASCPLSDSPPQKPASRASSRRSRQDARGPREDPISAWFARRGWTPFAFQREVWDAYRAGESGLIHAADRHRQDATPRASARARRSRRRAMQRPDRHPAARPLGDAAARARRRHGHSLRKRCDGARHRGPSSRRTGDTRPPSATASATRLPTASSPRPRACRLLLTRDDAASCSASCAAWSWTSGTSCSAQARGADRARAGAAPALAGRAPRPGASRPRSATSTSRCDALLGVGDGTRPAIVHGPAPEGDRRRRADPGHDRALPLGRASGPAAAAEVVAGDRGGRDRARLHQHPLAAEIWYQAILEARPDWAGIIALHHGSLDRAGRDGSRTACASGRLRCVVCTSSLDLGVDFTPVDRVLQIGSPKGVARLLQRAGRSGHQPGARQPA